MKSGNTWMRLLLDSLLRGGGEVDINHISSGCGAADREWFDRSMMMDPSNLTPGEIGTARAFMISAARKPQMFLKVHDANLPYPGTHAMPYAPESIRRVVHIVRDPRDVAVSYASHIGATLDLTNIGATLDVTIARMADADHVIGAKSSRLAEQLPQFVSSWTKHTTSWLDAPEFVGMTVRYETLLTDTTGQLDTIARFLKLDAPVAAVDRAVRAASFAHLRDQEAREGFHERPLEMERFFRRGIAGGWRDTLSDQQVRRITDEHGELMLRLGYLLD
jgi:aryl sulfotransferase